MSLANHSYITSRFIGLFVILNVLSPVLLSGCNTPVRKPPTEPIPTSSQSPTSQPSSTPQPSLTVTQTNLPSSPTLSIADLICSPFDSIPISQLTETISNPFTPPEPGSDKPHQGVDYAILDPDTRIALDGFPVNAIMAGKVSAVIQNRFPYGNAVIIETPLQGSTLIRLRATALPSPPPDFPTNLSLTCPQLTPSIGRTQSAPSGSTLSDDSSIYVLYAHLRDPIQVEPGDTIQCGEFLNVIGMSGNALNPHLHLEIRVGPTGKQFNSLAHYDTSATIPEMTNYCLWRVSGLFQLANPMSLLSSSP